MAAYGVGDIAINLFYTGLSLYLLRYYTDVLEIPPAIAGIAFMIPLVWDGVTDPLMGWIASRTRTRFGRYRPYLLFASPLMALSFVMMFAAPLVFPSAVLVSSVIAHIVFRTFYTMVAVPYGAMTAALTADSQERGYLTGIRMIAAVLGGVLTAALTIELASAFGGDNLIKGYAQVGALYAVIGTLILWVTFGASRERVALPDSGARFSLSDTYRFLARNRAFLILFFAVLFGSIGSAIGGKALLYYVQYYADSPGDVSRVVTLAFLAAGVSLPFWIFLSTRLSKRALWLTSATGTLILQAVLFVFAPTEIGSLTALVAINAFFLGAYGFVSFSMLPDTVEYGEWRSGVRDESIVFGLHQLALKIASGLGVGLLGLALGAIGYVANTQQSQETLEGIKVLSFLVPAGFTLISVSLIYFYPIDRVLHSRLLRAIEWRGTPGRIAREPV